MQPEHPTLNRFTISLDPQLAESFDQWLLDQGGLNRSEAVRDLIRARLGSDQLDAGRARWCIASVSYVLARHEAVVVANVLQLQHDNHDLVAAVQRIPIDHDDCLETITLRGNTAAVRACAARLMALRGVRHADVHLIALHQGHDSHRHADPVSTAHRHLEPVH